MISRVLTLVVAVTFAIAGCHKEPVDSSVDSGAHPRLVLTQEGVAKIRASLGSVPLLDSTVADTKAEVDAEIASGIDTPIPEDYSGGYSHEQHKRNFFLMQKAGVLYQILEDDVYANYVKDMLFEYEAMYASLPLHPKTRSYARGKLFWQCLNDANWLVYAAQAYDTIYEYLSADERHTLERNLFRPFADHISIANPRFFNRIHNHSTWGNAAVGMIGLVMGDEELVDRALHGLSPDIYELDLELKDDDGGFIFDQQGRAGFLANLDEPFSPDGYHMEGPYYQRYAMYPFLIFAQALHNTKPEMKIFEYNDRILIKGVDAMLALSDADGDFFPLNDGQKGMSYYTDAVVAAVDIAYLVGGNDPRLLSIAERQGKVVLDDAGMAVAAAIRDGKARPLLKTSINLSDGSDGSEGGIAVLRDPDEQLELVFKYSAQGSSHGHYDKLSFSLHEKGDEVLQDYGLARFVNVEQKGGGNYLPENSSWAKQTIAHNTVTLNQTSHFEGRYEVGSRHHPVLHFYDDTDEVRIISAKDSNVYPDTTLHRTMAILRHTSIEKPIVLDILKVTTNVANQYDLPFYFMGQVIGVNFEYKVPTPPTVLGKEAGYQHLYLEGRGRPSDTNAKFTWMDHQRFYTLTTTVGNEDELMFTRIGANDPSFNLRRDAAFMLRRHDVSDTTFVSAIEAHGSYSPVSELALNAKSSVSELAIIRDDKDYTVVSIGFVDGGRALFALANTDKLEGAGHCIFVEGVETCWSGAYSYKATRLQ